MCKRHAAQIRSGILAARHEFAHKIGTVPVRGALGHRAYIRTYARRAATAWTARNERLWKESQ